jgi:MtrB/PioB family decaheme-associated outer membrane protein
MKKTWSVTLLCALFLVPAPAPAGDEAAVTGSVTVDIVGVDRDGEESAKFDEYSDRGDGTSADLELRAFQPRYYLRLDAGNIGRADEKFSLEGGRFGQFKYTLFYDETPHHLSGGSSTFYAGAGGGELLATGVLSDPSRWQAVDFRIDRQSYGFTGEVSLGTPFYLRVGASEKKTDGTVPFSGNSTIAGFGSTTELPAPVDWAETKGFLEWGYRTRSLAASLKGEMSSFDNAREEFSWEDQLALSPAIRPDVSTGPPDNEFWKVSGQLVWRTPALGSSLSLRGSHSRLTSSSTIRTTVASDTPAGSSSIVVDPGTFDGDISYSTADAAWSLAPLEKLSLEVFLKYLDKNNDNTVVGFTAGDSRDETEVFEYTRKSAGLEASYSLAARSALDAGYSYVTVDREGRLDGTGSDDNLVFAQVRWGAWELLGLRGRYEYLDRSGEFEPKEAGTSPTASEYIRNFVRRFDVADQKRQSAKVEASTSIADLGLTLEGGWRDSDFDKTELGLTGMKHYDVYLNADYAREGVFSVTAYGGFENDRSEMSSRSFAPGTPADPAAGTVGSAFNWSETPEFDTVAYGVRVEAPLGKRLLFGAGWDRSDVDGKADFSTAGPTPLTDLNKVEDYTRDDVSADLTFRFAARFSCKVGYRFEKYDFADEQWDGYRVQPNAATLLTGAYAYSDYQAHSVFLQTTYSF